MKISPETFQAYRYFAQALDPIHIGTGDERLSRVDMVIVREPGTDLPKLPGTSLSGACRAYAAKQQSGTGHNCAGQGQEHEEQGQKIKGHCGQDNCPICQTFGYAKGNDAGGKKGAAQFTDAHIVAFPVASTNGPIWVTSPMALTGIGDEVQVPAEGTLMMNGVTPQDTIAIGWLALSGSSGFLIPINLSKGLIAAGISRIALVPDTLFPTIVNDNLEVRTSVAIDPRTGAAEEGALFTYEAVPTGTLFAFDVMYQPKEWTHESKPALTAQQTVEQGMGLFAWLGVGEMNTRGMGRLRVLEV